MNVLLHDRSHGDHGLLVDSLTIAPDGATAVGSFDAVIVHATERDAETMVRSAADALRPCCIFSGNLEAKEKLGQLATACPRLAVLSIAEMRKRLDCALAANSIDPLFREPEEDVLEVLTSLWAAALEWEQAKSCPYGDDSGAVSVDKLRQITLSNRERLGIVEGRVGLHGMETLVVTSKDDYLHALQNLRDAWLPAGAGSA